MSSATAATRTRLVEELMARFPHVPREAVLKEDLLKTGMAFDGSALSSQLAIRPRITLNLPDQTFAAHGAGLSSRATVGRSPAFLLFVLPPGTFPSSVVVLVDE